MRRILFWVLTGYLFYAGINNMMLLEEEGTLLEVPFLSGSSVGFTGLSFFSTASSYEKIAPSNKWAAILEGEWDFTTTINNEETTEKFKGVATYLADSTFTRYLSYELSNRGRSSAFFKAGGMVTGEWYITTDSTWVEVTKECIINIGYNDDDRGLDVCSMYFYNTTTYGVLPSSTKKIDLLHFNSAKIEIKRKDYTDGLTDTYLFTRKKN